MNYENYNTIALVYANNIEYRLCSNNAINAKMRPYIIIKYIHGINKYFHIDSFMSPIDEKNAILSFYNKYKNYDLLKKSNLTHIL